MPFTFPTRRAILLNGISGLLASAGAGHAQAEGKSSPEGRFEKIPGFAFDRLPLADAIRVVHGNGQRRIAVFSDPNCGHCKRVDKDLQAIGDVTVYVFLYPVLGADSLAKSRALWCSKDKPRAWADWVAAGAAPAAAAEACDTAGLQRGVALGRQFKVEGTPTLVFSDGTRVPGAIPARWISTLLDSSSAAARRPS